MKRMHIHLSVENLAVSIEFYNRLFGAVPTVEKTDYAKWMLEDPRMNFAISARGERPGLNHLGIQVEMAVELEAIQRRLQAADMAVLTQTGTTCCYAQSDKHWVQDPSGIAWEAYQTLHDAPTFSGANKDARNSACCTPAAANVTFTGHSA